MNDDPDWNPRYVSYALDHNKTPEDMLAFDRQRYPGGCMMGFMLWIDQKWATWRGVRNVRDRPALTVAVQKDFDSFIRRPCSCGNKAVGLAEDGTLICQMCLEAEAVPYLDEDPPE